MEKAVLDWIVLRKNGNNAVMFHCQSFLAPLLGVEFWVADKPPLQQGAIKWRGSLPSFSFNWKWALNFQALNVAWKCKWTAVDGGDLAGNLCCAFLKGIIFQKLVRKFPQCAFPRVLKRIKQILAHKKCLYLPDKWALMQFDLMLHKSAGFYAIWRRFLHLKALAHVGRHGCGCCHWWSCSQWIIMALD